MRKIFTLVFVSFLLAGNSIYAQKKVELKTLSDSLSYAYGIMIGHSMNEADAEIKQPRFFIAVAGAGFVEGFYR